MSSPTDGFCNKIGEYYAIWVFDHKIGAVMFALGVLYFIMSLVIIYFIKIQEYYARTGNDEAVQSVIFPMFVNVLWANAIVNIYVGCLALTYTFEPFSTDNIGATWAFSTMYALQHLGKELFEVLFCCFGMLLINLLTIFLMQSRREWP